MGSANPALLLLFAAWATVARHQPLLYRTNLSSAELEGAVMTQVHMARAA